MLFKRKTIEVPNDLPEHKIKLGKLEEFCDNMFRTITALSAKIETLNSQVKMLADAYQLEFTSKGLISKRNKYVCACGNRLSKTSNPNVFICSKCGNKYKKSSNML